MTDEITTLQFLEGALCAMRTSDLNNPQRKSSGSRFFIVQGYQVPKHQLHQYEQEKGLVYSDADRERYRTLGGYPFFDGDYTVFGEVVEGLDVIDKIAAQPRGAYARPQTDIKMNVKLSE